jgi:Zn ribbon nucleic-acid-binding protein
MQGRYGIDELYKFLFITYLITFFINLFINSLIIEYIGVLLVIIIFYRVLSKNIYKRNKENQQYLKIKNSIINPFQKIKRNLKDKDHIYRTCPKCKTTLKLPIPYERGIKHTKCSKCKKRLSIFTLKKQKIEIIKNKKIK